MSAAAKIESAETDCARRRLRVLHIVNWYPSDENQHKAPFVREQIDSLRPLASTTVVHVQTISGDERWSIRGGTRCNGVIFLFLRTTLPEGRAIEFLTALLLVIVRLRLGRKHWDVTNLHIAYPLFRFPGFVRLLFGSRIAVSEHWSAYRKGFNLPVGSPARARIAEMFSDTLPVAAVSHALAEDIRAFVGLDRMNVSIVPNVVDPAIFYTSTDSLRTPGRILMVANWAPIKRPFLVLEAFSRLCENHLDAELRIVGYGAQWQAMRDFVVMKGIEDHVTFIGGLSKPAIADEMRRARVFLHSSDYETFSVVCAEALSCGCPVIASNVGGIPEVVGTSGRLVENTYEAWFQVVADVLAERCVALQPNAETTARFSPEAVGRAYLEFLTGGHAL